MSLTLVASSPLADKLVQKLGLKAGGRFLDVSLRSKAVARQLHKDVRGLDPSHHLYASVMNQVTEMVELMQDLQELGPLLAGWQAAEAEYSPGYPPLSPLTTSFFASWVGYDLHHGAARETLGSICLKLVRTFGMHPERIRLLENLCHSHMGIFLNEGPTGKRVRLRDLVTGQSVAAVVPAGHSGNEGDLCAS